MSDQNLVNRRDFVKTAGSAVAATSLLGADAFAQAPAGRGVTPSSAPASAPPACGGARFDERYSDVIQFVGLCDINPKRVEGVEGADGRRLSDVHQLRRDARQGEARRRHGDDEGFVPQPVHRQGARPRVRRDDREADGHRREAVPGRARRREAQQEEDHRHVQLPLRAEAPHRQRDPDVGRDRQGAVGRLRLVSRRLSRRRLFPPLARVQERRRQPVGAQGDASFRSRELVARRRSGRGGGRRPAAGVRQERHDPRRELPRVSAQEGVPVLLRHRHEPDPHEALRRVRRRRRLLPRRVRVSATTSTSTTRCRRS